MKARIIHGFLIVLVLVINAEAQSLDTLEEVIIEAKSWTDNNTSIYSLKLEPDNARHTSSNNLYNSLNEKYGANFTQYGLSGLIAPRIRGTNPEHLAVMWNGINVNHAGLGQSNGFNIPMQSTDNVQLLYGGGSVPFGSGAIGGAILMNDRIQFRKEENLEIGSSYGSFERISAHTKYRYSDKRKFISVGYYRNQAQNNFEYINTADFRKPLVKQNNSAFQQNGITTTMAHKLGKKDQIRFYGWLHDGITEVQPTMNNRTSKDKQLDQMHRYKLSYLRDADFALIQVDAFYTSDDIEFNGEYSGIRRYGTRARISKQIFNFLQSGIGINSELFLPDYQNFPAKSSEIRTSFFAFERLEFKNLKAQLNLRYTYVNGYEVPLTPNVAISYNVLNKSPFKFSIKSSYSENFRLPTLNERYWIPNANPDILPEESQQLEYGFEASFKKVKIDVVAYQMNIKNAVQWIVVDSLWSDIRQTLYTDIFVPHNVYRIKSQGINSNLQIKKLKLAFFNLSGGLAYNYTSAVDTESDLQRLYTPEHSFNANSALEYHNFRLSASYQFVSERRTSSNYLEAFDLLNFSLSKRIMIKDHHIDLAFNVQNVLDETYQTYINRAMPGRNYLITLNYNLKLNAYN